MSQLLSKKIIAWYQKHQRTLPWRFHKNSKDRDYKVLLSEIMLQQTKVSTVIPYFNNFYKKFPSLESLSKSPITSVLKLWEGLGYYRRARNLHEISKIVVKEHKGILPDSFLKLKSLPGIGNYTASAILSIAKNKPYIGIDGNVRRVVSRIFNFKEDKKIISNIENKLSTMKVVHKSGDLMQGIMEIGALVCLSKEPKCNICPLKKNCISFQNNTFNKKTKKKKVQIRYFYAFYIKKKNKILFSYNKKFNFLNNLINFPLIETKNINRQIAADKLFIQSKVDKKFLLKFIYKMSNFIMHIKITKLTHVIFDNNLYFWIDINKINKFTISVLTRKLLDLSHNEK